MAKYHINPETGNPNICRAKTPERCIYSTEDTVAEHFDSKDEARSAYEKQMEQEEEKKRQDEVRKRNDLEERREKSWPTPSEDSIREMESKGYNVNPATKGLHFSEINDDGTRVEMYYMAGSSSLSAQFYSGKSSTSSVWVSDNYEDISISSDGKISEGDKPYSIKFNDYGAGLSIDEAEKHLKDLNTVNRRLPDFERKISQMIEDSEKLYGSPSEDYPNRSSQKLYKKYNPIENYESQDVSVGGRETDGVISRGDFGDKVTYPPRRDGSKRSFEVHSVRGFGVSKDSVQVNMTSVGTAEEDSTYESYRRRANELADAIADARKMEKDLKKS